MNRICAGAGQLGGKPVLRMPAVQAVSIQACALPIVAGAGYAVALLAGWPLPLAMAALLQGVIAAALSHWRGLAPWWLPMQAVFPIALVGTLSLQLPPAMFLVAFIVLLALYWTTFRTQVPFYPSGPGAWDAVAGMLPDDRPVRVVDIGSGLGGLVLHAARTREEGMFTGIEIAPLPWFVSVLRRSFSGLRNARFVRGDYGRLDFGSYDVVFAYLSPAAMPALWQKARAEMRAGALLLSYEFDIPGVAPHLTVTPRGSGRLLYGWRM
jgi:hypothetical protein